MRRACSTHKRYDTLFVAERAAAISSDKWKTEIEAFACGNHYHIGHKDPSLWGKMPERRNYCDACGNDVNPHNWQKHIRTKGHITRVAVQKEKPR